MRLELVTIPAGPFLMGSAHGQADELPVHEVWLDEFALAIVPVTNRDYERFVAATGHPPAPWSLRPGFDLPDQPVVAVTWFDAVAYCAWLRTCTGLPCRLPTEAEREKAALGGKNGTRYPWGDAAPAAGASGPLLGLPIVAADAANGLGLHNLGDLVHEWCSDWYASDYYRHSPARDPRGPEAGTRRSSRGGSWRHRIPFTPCAARSSVPPDRAYADYGFRVAVGGNGSPR